MINKIIPFISQFDENTIKLLTKKAQFKTFSKGEVIHLEEDTCTSLEIVVSGSVSVSYISNNGDSSIIKVLNEESFISPNNLFASNPKYFVYIEALKDTKIMSIPKKFVNQALDCESFRSVFLALLSDTGKMMGSKFIFEQKTDLRTKIIVYLKHHKHIQKSSYITLPISKTLLASNFGVARTSLSREFQKMRVEGIIQFSNKKIMLNEENYDW